MGQIAAGLLMYQERNSMLYIFLAHPGGPFFKKKDIGAWSIPKGLQETDEDLLQTAQREFQEETGIVPHGPYLELGSIKSKGGKTVFAWAFKRDDEVKYVLSNTFTIEWPPKSGKMQEFPEIDKAEFMPVDEAFLKINEAQRTFIDRLIEATS